MVSSCAFLRIAEQYKGKKLFTVYYVYENLFMVMLFKSRKMKPGSRAQSVVHLTAYPGIASLNPSSAI